MLTSRQEEVVDGTMRYFLLLTDGVTSHRNAFLSPSHQHLVETKTLKRGSLVRLDKYHRSNKVLMHEEET